MGYRKVKITHIPDMTCVREIAPAGPQDYADVEEVYNCIAKERGWINRGKKPLRGKFDKVRDACSYLLYD